MPLLTDSNAKSSQTCAKTLGFGSASVKMDEALARSSIISSMDLFQQRGLANIISEHYGTISLEDS